MWSKFAEVQCAFAVAEVRKVTANLSQTCGFVVAGHLLQFCGIKCKFAVPSSGKKWMDQWKKRLVMKLWKQCKG